MNIYTLYGKGNSQSRLIGKKEVIQNEYQQVHLRGQLHAESKQVPQLQGIKNFDVQMNPQGFKLQFRGQQRTTKMNKIKSQVFRMYESVANDATGSCRGWFDQQDMKKSMLQQRMKKDSIRLNMKQGHSCDDVRSDYRHKNYSPRQWTHHPYPPYQYSQHCQPVVYHVHTPIVHCCGRVEIGCGHCQDGKNVCCRQKYQGCEKQGCNTDRMTASQGASKQVSLQWSCKIPQGQDTTKLKKTAQWLQNATKQCESRLRYSAKNDPAVDTFGNLKRCATLNQLARIEQTPSPSSRLSLLKEQCNYLRRQCIKHFEQRHKVVEDSGKK